MLRRILNCQGRDSVSALYKRLRKESPPFPAEINSLPHHNGLVARTPENSEKPENERRAEGAEAEWGPPSHWTKTVEN